MRWGAPGERLPPPATRWRSEVIDEDTRAPVRLEMEDAGGSDALDVRYVGCDRPEESCGVRVERIESEPTYDPLYGVVMVSETRALLTGGGRAPLEDATELGRVDDRRVTLLPLQPGIAGRGRGLSWGGGGFVYGGTGGGSFFAMTVDGAVTTTIAAGGPIRSVSAARDGTTLVVTDDGAVASYTPGMKTLVPRPDAPPRTAFILAARRDRIFAFGESGSIGYFDGREWRAELPPSADFRFAAVAGDEAHVAAASRYFTALVRDESTGAWRDFGRPFDTFPQAIVHVGGGRFLVVGDGGSAAISADGGWCAFDTGTRLHLYAVDASPDRRFAIAVGKNDAPWAPPIVIRISLGP